nr:hypothetical protein 50 [Burkholderiaceae bacterium]
MATHRPFSPKYYKTIEWFETHKEGFATDIAKLINCNVSQFKTYCHKLVNEGKLIRSEKTIPGRRARGSYYTLVNTHTVRKSSWYNPDLPATLSLLTAAEMAANGAFNPRGYVSEGRHKRQSYGPDMIEKQRIEKERQEKRERKEKIRRLHEQIRPTRPQTAVNE